MARGGEDSGEGEELGIGDAGPAAVKQILGDKPKNGNKVVARVDSSDGHVGARYEEMDDTLLQKRSS